MALLTSAQMGMAHRRAMEMAVSYGGDEEEGEGERGGDVRETGNGRKVEDGDVASSTDLKNGESIRDCAE